MKLLRYLLSHGLLIIFIITIAISYIYRTQLFPENITVQVDHYVNKSLGWVENITGKKDEDKTAVTTGEQNIEATQKPATVSQKENTKEDEATPKKTASSEIIPNDTSLGETASDKALPANREEMAHYDDSEEPEETHMQPPAIDDNTMPVPEEPKTDELTDNNNSTDAHDMTSVETDQAIASIPHAVLLNNARLAYENGNPDLAVKLYKELSELNPDDPNVYGEMGNVFYAQGKWKQAGIAFYEAAVCLLDQGESQQVPYLYRVIQGLDQESAEKLRTRLIR